MTRMRRQRLLFGALIYLFISPAMAQSDRVYRSVRVPSNKETQIALFARANTKECTPLPLPEIRVIAAPEHGSLVVRSTTLTTNQDQRCPNLKLQAQVLLYRSTSDYVGSDIVSFAVTFEGGKTEAHQISITVVKENKAALKPEQL
jgi:hypothetical protein